MDIDSKFSLWFPKIHDNVDLVLGMKNIFELEGIIDSRESCFSFLSRSIPIFPSNNCGDSSIITKDGHGRCSFC